MLAQGITYNTTMGLAAGAFMLLLFVFVRVAQRPGRRTIEGWAWMFLALGLFLAITGTHMTLTWPLKQIPGAPCCAVDNVTFGEPAMYFGILIIFGAIAIIRAERAAAERGVEFDLVATVRPFLYAGAFGGVGLIMIAAAGLQFGLWAPAPPDEPIARLMGDSILERFFVAAAYCITALATITAPFAPERRVVGRIFVVALFVAGMMWTFLSLTLFYGHVGFFPY